MYKDKTTQFWNSSPEALFNQKTIADVLQISKAKLERDRWLGGGIPYLKVGAAVRYRKKEVLSWLQKYAPTITSTSQNQPEIKTND